MSLIDKLSTNLQIHPKRVIYPEGHDPRIIQAARQFANRCLGIPILIGDRSIIKQNAEQLDIKLDGIRLLEPERSPELELMTQKFKGLQRFRGLNDREALDYLLNNNYFATMLLATGHADAIVSGATCVSSSALRPLFQIIPTQKNIHTASSMLILELEDPKLGIDGALFLADCGVIPNPDAEQLADIAVTTAALAEHLTQQTPKLAMLSYTTKASNSKDANVMKVKAATTLAQKKASSMDVKIQIDGELQVDTALVPFVAQQKCLQSSVAGIANILIFPDLISGNIASKLAQIITGAGSYGQIITGLAKPAAEISRGATARDIFGTTVVVAALAIDHIRQYDKVTQP